METPAIRPQTQKDPKRQLRGWKHRFHSSKIKINKNHQETQLFATLSEQKCQSENSPFSFSLIFFLSKLIQFHSSTGFWCVFSPPRSIWPCLFQPCLFIAPPRLLLLPRQLDQENGQINGLCLLGKPGRCEADIGSAKAASEKSSLPRQNSPEHGIIVNVLLQRANGGAAAPH